MLPGSERRRKGRNHATSPCSAGMGRRVRQFHQHVLHPKSEGRVTLIKAAERYPEVLIGHGPTSEVVDRLVIPRGGRAGIAGGA